MKVYQQVFQDLKTYLAKLPLLTKPTPAQLLYVYLVVRQHVVSSVLIKEVEGNQKAIYYVNKVLHGAEQQYTKVDKLAFALVIIARKQHLYFLSLSIIVHTNASLRATLGKAETSDRMIMWAIELNEYDISYKPWMAIKAQTLVEFVEDDEGKWLLHVDGSSILADSGVGVVLTSPEGMS
ncbi:UNVERIFIED_CONTAM: hypothetical protein Sradi_3176500 [Sesamum radiatum]|uniref:Reverse transcriptase/retrotransposon-derived protein RNase H-like domain-containing protein n=1 Tax=Sesamum radiatum TaxID=300843 RepID=A0AAW2REU8_SESRA